jgi:predicted Zn-dependent protease
MSASRYTVGVMTMDVEGRDSERFHRRVDAAVRRVEAEMLARLGLQVDLLGFEGPHLTPDAGAYSPLDFLRVAAGEKLERGVHFLLVVTEVDLSASVRSYALALPSRIANVGIVSTKRLDPAFWGDEGGDEVLVERLAHLLFHTFGHLVNLPYSDDPGNAMYRFARVEELDAMETLTPEQFAAVERALPREAHERTSRGGSPLGFAARSLARNARGIASAVAQANPLRLAAELPTMITAALSVILLLFFSPEPWDVASTVDLYQLALFGGAAVVGATLVLYRAFALGARVDRTHVLSESTVVTAAATGIVLLLTMTVLFALFGLGTFAAILTVFPEKLMATWPTVDPAVRRLDHVKLSVFVAGLGLLAGSLGGRADSRALVRRVLFVGDDA